MKKKVLISFLIIFLFISSLNAFEIPFGEEFGKDIIVKPLIYNATILSYYDNGSMVKYYAPVLLVSIKVISKDFNPYKAKAYAKINDNFTINFEFDEGLMNIYPSYVDTYYFHGRISPYSFGLDYKTDDTAYIKMLDEINNITFYLEYGDQTFTYTFDFTKYRDFLKEFNNSIEAIDSSNYPVVSWTPTNDNISQIGITLFYGNEDNWDDPNIPANGKIDDNERAFAGWFSTDNLTDNSFDFSTFPGLMLSKEIYILKIKNIKSFSNEGEGSAVIRLLVAFRKVPYEKCKPITNVSGWHLLGTNEPTFIDNIGNDFDLNKVNTIWTWSGNGWRIWSPDEDIMKLIDSYGLETLKVIYRDSGVWFNFK